jgi:hypothetical protein
MELSIIFVLAAIIILGAGLFALMCLKKSGSKLDIEKYRVKYLEIENSLKRDEPSSYSLVVLNADKLVDAALKDRRIKGETMGERMKNARELFSSNDSIWSAHKLRNHIAHDTDVHISYNDASIALANFKRALKDLGAI